MKKSELRAIIFECLDEIQNYSTQERPTNKKIRKRVVAESIVQLNECGTHDHGPYDYCGGWLDAERDRERNKPAGWSRQQRIRRTNYSSPQSKMTQKRAAPKKKLVRVK